MFGVTGDLNTEYSSNRKTLQTSLQKTSKPKVFFPGRGIPVGAMGRGLCLQNRIKRIIR